MAPVAASPPLAGAQPSSSSSSEPSDAPSGSRSRFFSTVWLTPSRPDTAADRTSARPADAVAPRAGL